MKNLKLFTLALTAGIVIAGSFAAPAYAWHPEVKITKYVTNQTAGGVMTDANDTENAVSTKPNNLIKYTMVIENTAPPAGNGHNDLHFTKMTDTLPVGVQLNDDATKRHITEDLGILKPGQKITKEYLLKVTSTKNGDIILNEACVTGDSEVKDAFRKDCDVAVIKVTVPPVVMPPPTPELPKETPKVMPVTGPANVLVPAGAVTLLGYLGNLLRLKRRASKS